jgi:hypothetical protein
MRRGPGGQHGVADHLQDHAVIGLYRLKNSLIISIHEAGQRLGVHAFGKAGIFRGIGNQADAVKELPAVIKVVDVAG